MPVEQATEVGCNMQESNLHRDHEIVFYCDVSFFLFVATYFLRGVCATVLL